MKATKKQKSQKKVIFKNYQRPQGKKIIFTIMYHPPNQPKIGSSVVLPW
jgi:hypothetical protein